MKDYYKILEIHPEASLEIMTKAYRTLVQKYHPDHYYMTAHKRQMEQKLQAINEAYSVLSDPIHRQNYDEQFRGYQDSLRDVPNASQRKKRQQKLTYWFALTLFLFLTIRILFRILCCGALIIKLPLFAALLWIGYWFWQRARA
jgi:curved DNA-binding protein CbpA